MLVLTRRVGETVRIGDDIELTISEIRGKSIRLAITAPKDIAILRGELAKSEAPDQTLELPAEPIATWRRKDLSQTNVNSQTPAIAH